MAAALAVVEPEEIEEEETPTYASAEFDADFQEKIAALALRDTIFLIRTDGLIDPAYFERDVDGAIVKVALDYFATYKKAPDRGSLGVVLKDAFLARKVRSDLVKDVRDRLPELLKADLGDRDLVIDKVADFARNKALENAIMASVELLEKRDYAGVKRLVDTASLVGASEAMGGIDYWDEDAIETRTEKRRAILTGVVKHDSVTTGFEELDKCLYQRGWAKKELSCILGAAKAGKSMSLGQFGKDASLAGHNVLYVSCEVSAEIITDRCDSNVSEIAMKVLAEHPNDVAAKVRATRAKAGKFIIRDYPSGTFKCSQLRRLLEYYRGRGIIFDLVIVDYADIMCPETRRNETRDELNAIYLDLRAISHEYHCALLTATQTNREGAKGALAKATDVAEDFNKARTVDLLLSINATDDEKATNEARIFFALHRNGEDNFSLRIRQDRSRMKFISKILGRE